MKIGTWLLAMMQPLIARILTVLGLSVVTITGFDVVVDTLKARLVSSVNSLPADLLNIFLLAGGGVGLSMICSAIAVRMLLWQIQSATKILGVNPQ
jgi:hypothetical protein